jgi:hypothetical protein
MTKYWIAVASKEHVKKGVAGGFAQVCHGKGGPLNKMVPGDWILYYSPVEIFGEKIPCRKFTDIGKIRENDPYEFRMSDDFNPWRRDVHFFPAKDVSIEPLIGNLTFIKNKQQWGFPFRRGCFEIPKSDFTLIADAMGVDTHD